jgi:hypothetical protein
MAQHVFLEFYEEKCLPEEKEFGFLRVCRMAGTVDMSE